MIRRLIRRVQARRRLRTAVGVWYHSAYAAPSVADTIRVPGVDPRRGEHVIAELAGEGLLHPGDVQAAPFATLEELLRFHPLEYVERSEDPAVVARAFGLPTERLAVEPLLEAQRRAVGGTLAAARAVARGARSVAMNLGGGFHHAEPDRGGGFCLYNDVGVAIRTLRAEGYTRAVAIIDLDFHQGNGNLVGFRGDASVSYFAISGSRWVHLEPEDPHDLLLPTGTGDRAYLDVLRARLGPFLAARRPGLVFYIAGNDVLGGDRLGDFTLTRRGVLTRDRLVLDAVKDVGAGLVVTMGGGYSKDAWRATAAFLRYVLTGSTRMRRREPTNLRAHFLAVARELDPHELTRESSRESSREPAAEDPFGLTMADLQEDRLFGAPPRKILDFYTVHGVEVAFERYGISDKIRARGFTELRFEIDPSHPDRQLVRLFGKKLEWHVLIELAIKKRRIAAPEGVEPSDDLELLSIEWLLLQDPTSSFTLERPPLPGQEHPGLGIAEHIQELLVRAAIRVGLEGLIDRPAHYHNAVAPERSFHFLDPREEGRLRAFRAVLKDYAIADASRLVDARGLGLVDGTRMAWAPSDHVLPISDRLKRYFESEAYETAARDAMEDILAAGLAVYA